MAYLLIVIVSKISGMVVFIIDSAICIWVKLEVCIIISLLCCVSILRLSNVLSRVVIGKKICIFFGMFSKVYIFVFNVL